MSGRRTKLHNRYQAALNIDDQFPGHLRDWAADERRRWVTKIANRAMTQGRDFTTLPRWVRRAWKQLTTPPAPVAA